MLIGLMSDSHDNIQGVKDALREFSKRGIKLVLHAGDMIGSGNYYTFEGYDMELRLVYGNNDGDREGLMSNFAKVGGQYLGDFGVVNAGGLRIALLHGTDEPVVEALVRSEMYDVVVRGHNHQLNVERRGKTLLVNPGEIWGHFTGLRSVAVLDTDTLEVEVIELGRDKTFREIIRS